MSDIEFLLLELTSVRQIIEAAYQNARGGLKKRIKNNVELTKK